LRSRPAPELASVLTPPTERHSWPAMIPSPCFGQRPSEPVEYIPVEPATVVELDVGTSFHSTGDRMRPATSGYGQSRIRDLSPLPDDACS
jgi:hypothetical protein